MFGTVPRVRSYVITIDGIDRYVPAAELVADSGKLPANMLDERTVIANEHDEIGVRTVPQLMDDAVRVR